MKPVHTIVLFILHVSLVVESIKKTMVYFHSLILLNTKKTELFLLGLHDSKVKTSS